MQTVSLNCVTILHYISSIMLISRRFKYLQIIFHISVSKDVKGNGRGLSETVRQHCIEENNEKLD